MFSCFAVSHEDTLSIHHIALNDVLTARHLTSDRDGMMFEVFAEVLWRVLSVEAGGRYENTFTESYAQ